MFVVSPPEQRHGGMKVAGAGCEIGDLPFGRHLGRQFGERRRLNDDGKDPLVEALGEQEFRQTPLGCRPDRRDEEHHQLAAFGGALQGLLPALPGLQSALGIEVEKHIVPAMRDHPVTDGDGLSVVRARMGDENT